MKRLLCILILLLLLPAGVRARDPSREGRLLAGGGSFDDNDGASDFFHLEYRSPRRILGPLPGFLALSSTTKDARVFAAGLYHDIGLGRRLVATPSLGLAYYHQGDDKSLGANVQVRSAIQLSYRLANGWRVGGAYHHLSNASASGPNPGAESYLVVVSVPLR